MKRKLLGLLLGCAVFALALPAGAQTLTRLDRVSIALWPEYDQPGVLVIVQAELPGDTAFPTQLEMLIPGDVGQPFAVAQRASDNRLVNADFDFREGPEGWSTVIITAETSIVWVEYYDDLVIDGDSRRFEYHWPGTPIASELVYEVQHPVGASQFSLDPEALEEDIGADGLVYSRGPLGTLPGNDQPSVLLEYQKQSSILSIDSLEVSGASDTAQPSTPGAGLRGADWITYAVGGVGLALLLGAGFLYWKTRQGDAPGPKRRRARGRTGESQGRYCHSCGSRVSSEDRFCRSCGAVLRRE